MRAYREPWWKTPPMFSGDWREDVVFKSICIGWLVIVWTVDPFKIESIMWDPD